MTKKLLDAIYFVVGSYLVLFLGWFLLTFALMFMSAGNISICEKPVYRNVETMIPARKLTCWLFEPSEK